MIMLEISRLIRNMISTQLWTQELNHLRIKKNQNLFLRKFMIRYAQKTRRINIKKVRNVPKPSLYGTLL